MRLPQHLALSLIALAVVTVATGCGASPPKIGPSAQAAPNDRAEKTLTMLERLPLAERQATIDRTPQIKAVLDGASDPGLKARIERLKMP